MQSITKKHIYCIPGLGASSKIFEYINLPENEFEMHFLDWISPLNLNEDLKSYSERLSNNIREENIYLIGVSFGGVIAQEIARKLSVHKVILISSIKHESEIPNRLNVLKNLKFYYLAPLFGMFNYEKLQKLAVGKMLKRKLFLYNKYMKISDKLYLIWATKNMLKWKQKEAPTNLVHLHGDKDIIFPSKYLNNFIRIENGRHEMVLTHAKKISNLLKEILRNDH